MKSMLLILSILISFNISAQVMNGTIDEVICAEMDPFVVGDVCIVFSTDLQSGSSVGLVYRDYDFAYQYLNNLMDWDEFVGREFSADYCEHLTNFNEIGVLKSFNPNYFYLNCELQGFQFLDK